MLVLADDFKRSISRSWIYTKEVMSADGIAHRCNQAVLAGAQMVNFGAVVGVVRGDHWDSEGGASTTTRLQVPLTQKIGLCQGLETLTGSRLSSIDSKPTWRRPQGASQVHGEAGRNFLS